VTSRASDAFGALVFIVALTGAIDAFADVDGVEAATEVCAVDADADFTGALCAGGAGAEAGLTLTEATGVFTSGDAVAEDGGFNGAADAAAAGCAAIVGALGCAATGGALGVTEGCGAGATGATAGEGFTATAARATDASAGVLSVSSGSAGKSGKALSGT